MSVNFPGKYYFLLRKKIILSFKFLKADDYVLFKTSYKEQQQQQQKNKH